MRHLLAFLLCLLLIGSSTGCSTAQTAGDPGPCGPTGTPLRRAPPALTRLLATLQKAYAGGNWSAVRGEVADPNVATGLVTQLRAWSGHHVTHLTLSLVYVEQLSGGRYVGTVSYQADPRVPPVIALYLFGMRNGALRILSTVQGVCGSSYTQATWEVTRTQHFIVYHSPFQLAGSDHVYLTYLERQRALFAARFRVRLAPIAAVYLYPSQPLMRTLTHGACGRSSNEIGCTDPFDSPPAIQTTMGAFYHEPIHVYERSISPPNKGREVYYAPLFIGEGTAVALEDRQLDPRLSDYCSDLDYAPLDDCARIAVADVNPMSVLSDTGFNRANPGDGYALGGSFVKFLILRGGYYRFGRFYDVLAAQPKDRVQDYDVAARQVYGQNIQGLISAWRRSLCSRGC